MSYLCDSQMDTLLSHIDAIELRIKEAQDLILELKRENDRLCQEVGRLEADKNTVLRELVQLRTTSQALVQDMTALQTEYAQLQKVNAGMVTKQPQGTGLVERILQQSGQDLRSDLADGTAGATLPDKKKWEQHVRNLDNCIEWIKKM